MPTYIYRRQDGSTFEIQQRITEEPLQLCPSTGQQVKRVISGNAGLIFKGSGFYLTDYARSGSKSSTEQTSSDGEGKSAEAKPAETKKEETPAKASSDS